MTPVTNGDGWGGWVGGVVWCVGVGVHVVGCGWPLNRWESEWVGG